jgi:hypothetical protein
MAQCCYAEWRYTECHLLASSMLAIVMLSVTYKPSMLSVIILNVTYKPSMLSVVLLIVTYKPSTLSVFMLNVIILSVVAPVDSLASSSLFM